MIETGSQQITPALSLSWQHEGKTVVFIWQNVSRDTVDAYEQAYLNILDQLPPNQKVINQMNVVQFPGFAMTPYLRKAVENIAKTTQQREFHGKVAIVMNRTLNTIPMELFIRAMSVFVRDTTTRVFLNTDDALAWLGN